MGTSLSGARWRWWLQRRSHTISLSKHYERCEPQLASIGPLPLAHHALSQFWCTDPSTLECPPTHLRSWQFVHYRGRSGPQRCSSSEKFSSIICRQSSPGPPEPSLFCTPPLRWRWPSGRRGLNWVPWSHRRWKLSATEHASSGGARPFPSKPFRYSVDVSL